MNPPRQREDRATDELLFRIDRIQVPLIRNEFGASLANSFSFRLDEVSMSLLFTKFPYYYFNFIVSEIILQVAFFGRLCTLP